MLNFFSGNVNGVKITKGIVAIPKIFPQDDFIRATVEGNGRVADMLKIADNLPTTNIKQSGIVPDEVGGHGDIKVNFIKVHGSYASNIQDNNDIINYMRQIEPQYASDLITKYSRKFHIHPSMFYKHLTVLN